MTDLLSNERLEKIASWRETYGAESNVMLPAAEAEELARRELQRREAAEKPVFSIEVSGSHWLNCDDGKLTPEPDADFTDWPDGVCRLYLEPPLTSTERERLVAYERAAKESVATVEIGVNGNHVAEFKADVKVGAKLFTAPPLPVVPDAIDAAVNEVLAIDTVASTAVIKSLFHQYTGKMRLDAAAPHQLSGNSEQVNHSVDATNMGNHPVIPEGWALVPENLTTEMRNAWDSAPMSDDDSQNMRDAYRAMLYSAPRPPAATPTRYMNRFTGMCFTLEQQPGADTDTDVYVPLYERQPGKGE